MLTSCLFAPSVPDADDDYAELFPAEMLPVGENLFVHDMYAEPVHYSPAAPVEGGSISMSMRHPVTLNPLLNEDESVAKILRLIYEPLIGLDAEHRPYSYILSSFELSENGQIATLTLRDDIYWEDGTPITAADIVFSLNTIGRAGENSIYRHVQDGIVNYSTLDGGRALAIVYSSANYSFAYRLNFPVIPQHRHSGTGQNDPSAAVNMSPLASGPFRVSTYREAQELVLLPNHRALRGRANIGRVNVLIVPDTATKMSAFNERVIDVIDSDVSTWRRHRSTNMPNIISYASSNFEFIGFNFGNPAFADINLRRAIAHSVNIDDIISGIYINQALRAYSPINPAAWFYDPAVLSFGYNTEQARRLLEEAGYSHFSSRGFRGSSHDGIVSELHLRIIVNSENDERVNIAGILSDGLRALQVSNEVVRLDFDGYTQALRDGDFDMFIGGAAMPVYGDISFMFSSGGELNFFRYSSVVMDALLHQVDASISEAEFASSVSQLQDFFAYDLPAISLVFRKYALLSSHDIGGDITPTIHNAFSNIHEWFVDRP